MPCSRVLRPFPFVTAVEHYRAEKRAQIDADLPSFREDDLVCESVVPTESVGLKRFRLYEETLENGFGHNWRRERVQREYHELCSNGLAALILGDDWERDGPELCRARKWSYRSQLVICKLPRRFGKSVATAQVMAALAVAFSIYPPGENFTIGSFSTGKRASSGLADYCLQLLQAAGMMDRVIKHNQETVWLRTGEPDDEIAPVIKINFYPSNKKISSFSVSFILPLPGRPPPFSSICISVYTRRTSKKDCLITSTRRASKKDRTLHA